MRGVKTTTHTHTRSSETVSHSIIIISPIKVNTMSKQKKIQ